MKVKQERALTRTEIIERVVEKTGLSKKEVGNVLQETAALMAAQMKTKDPEGKFFPFVIPFTGIKAQVIIKPATKKRMGRNPATGEDVEIPAKKARKAVKARVMKALKDAVL